jgi:hypothetical protein
MIKGKPQTASTKTPSKPKLSPPPAFLNDSQLIDRTMETIYVAMEKCSPAQLFILNLLHERWGLSRVTANEIAGNTEYIETAKLTCGGRGRMHRVSMDIRSLRKEIQFCRYWPTSADIILWHRTVRASSLFNCSDVGWMD